MWLPVREERSRLDWQSSFRNSEVLEFVLDLWNQFDFWLTKCGLTVAPWEWLGTNVHVVVLLELRTRVAEVLLLSEVAVDRADYDRREADVVGDLLPFLGGRVQFFERATMSVLTNESRRNRQTL